MTDAIVTETRYCRLCNSLKGGNPESGFTGWVSYTNRIAPNSSEYRVYWCCDTCRNLIKKIVEDIEDIEGDTQ
jgi:hypothetical protein